jgi:hypothetical protein
VDLVLLLWLCVAGYAVGQVVALLRTSGQARLAAGLPLVVMLPILAFTVVSLARESNLWPLPLLFASPFALLYVAVVGLFTRQPDKQSAPNR